MKTAAYLLIACVGLGCTEVTDEGALGDARPAPICADGQRQCSGDKQTELCVDGQWSPADSCASDEVCEGGVCEPCPSISFSVETFQSCALELKPGTTVDAESFINVSGQDYRVMAMDEWGAGHIMAWCDSSSFGGVIDAFDALGYLGQVPNPRVASFGDPAQCQPPNAPDCAQSGLCTALPSTIQYLGEELPAMYEGNATQLAADWDVLVFCGFKIPWAADSSAELAEFVSVHGKGLAAIGEYHTYAYPQDFVKMSEITGAAGILFEEINLAWASTATDVVLDCVPGVPPVD